MSNQNKEKAPRWAFWRWKLHMQILAGLLVGAAIGCLSGIVAVNAAVAGEGVASEIVVKRWDFMLYDLLGDLFLNGLKLVIIPLVTSSIVLAIVGIGSGKGVGRLGLKTLAYYLCTSTIAILIGLTAINLVKPGATESGKPLLTSAQTQQFEKEAAILKSKVGEKTPSDFLDVFRKMIPDNPVKAAVEGNLLGLIVVSLLVGYFLTRIPGSPGQTMSDFWRAVYEISIRITELVLKVAPIGVGMLIAATMAENYAKLAQEERFAEFVGGIISFSFTVLGALVLHFCVMSVFVALIAKVNPYRHYKAMAPALLTAFSTASSSATLPLTMDCVEHRAGVSRKTTSFVLPLGATVNMDGTALYECAAAIFITQAFGVDLSFGQQFFVVMVALLTSVGVAGVPSASLVAIIIILQSLSTQLASSGINVPLEAGLPILLVFDRLLDMCRTALNVFSDSVGAVFIAKTEGEKNILN